MSLIKLGNLDGDVVESTSAVTKKQIETGAILFGRNSAIILKRLEELIKIKELETSKLSAIFDVIADEATATAFMKKASGKTLVTAVKNLYKAKTLVATINALRAIRIKVTAGNITPSKTTRPVKEDAAAVGKPTEKVKVVATRVDKNAALPKVDLATVTGRTMETINQAKIDAIAAQLSSATGLAFVGHYSETNGQSSPWTFEAQNPSAKYKSVSIDPPFNSRTSKGAATWQISCVDKSGGIFVGQDFKRPTAATLAKGIKGLISSGAAAKNSKKQYDMNMLFEQIQDTTSSERGAHSDAKNLLSIFGLKPKNSKTYAFEASYGGSEVAIGLNDSQAKSGVLFGKSNGFTDNLRDLKGSGMYTIVTWTRDGGELPTDLPMNHFKQQGVFKTYDEFYAALEKTLKKFAQ
ncbi:hypothetical protein HOS33_gp174 [Erwinia phage vB_EamM_Y3]|uniref:Uncharacterized protein n=1 Tax=Erwinia phage vB_EamM_Y3 TaxID=1983553 RepID=A0A2H4IB92_9CAUD|nr:hypothetical protein HOS33_gp174 [Erwinia phage vB_EamM_Y3]ARW58814.1 hypothetical protein Y3_174 [Erwinia phage vB_EamM_Y3]QZE56037.1 hypothetical protein pEaSNUABM52_00179 [Erwinia phage pEp_SNUABM_52]